MKLFELSFRYDENEFACMLFEVIALIPFVFSSFKKALFEIAYCVYSVKMFKDLSWDIISSNPALSYPQKPLFSIVSLKQLHFDKLFLILGAKIDFLQSEFNAVILKDFYIPNLTLRVHLDVWEKSLIGKDLAVLNFLDKFVEFTFAWLDLCILCMMFRDSFFITFIFAVNALRLEFDTLNVLSRLTYVGRHMRALRYLRRLLNGDLRCILNWLVEHFGVDLNRLWLWH